MQVRGEASPENHQEILEKNNQKADFLSSVADNNFDVLPFFFF